MNQLIHLLKRLEELCQRLWQKGAEKIQPQIQSHGSNVVSGLRHLPLWGYWWQ